MRIAQIVVGIFDTISRSEKLLQRWKKIEDLIKANKAADINILFRVFLESINFHRQVM